GNERGIQSVCSFRITVLSPSDGDRGCPAAGLPLLSQPARLDRRTVRNVELRGITPRHGER
ncbi:MAG TPA: hypothetical protein VNL91_03685, partial [Thermoanaerobaculia bacterium]|nr:hypothetical protein [Thermoanaerobaculia bacterium]